MTQETDSYFINPKEKPNLKQMAGLETTILTGLHGQEFLYSEALFMEVRRQPDNTISGNKLEKIRVKKWEL